jgi:outer membrane protein TolC
MDVYGLHQFDAIVAAAEAKLEIAAQSYGAAVRDLLRILKLPPETRIRIVSGLSENPPSTDVPSALNSAYAKRTDYRNALLETENAAMAMRMYENSDLPSLSVDVNLEMRGQDENSSSAVRDITAGAYPSWSVYLRASHPLGDTGQAAISGTRR